VIFDRKTSRGTEFQACDLLQPSTSLPREAPTVCVTRALVFLTPRNFFRHSWFEMVRFAVTPYPQHLANASSKLFRQLPLRPGPISIRSVTMSTGAHILGLMCLPFLWNSLSSSADENRFPRVHQAGIVYYRFARPLQKGSVPKILPSGPGSIPGSGTLPEQPTVHGATKTLGPVFAVSHPKLPDNDHQSILQSASSPELRIKSDVKLPNLIGENRTAPKKPLNFHAESVRPLAPSKKENSILDPELKATNSNAGIAATIAAEHQPRLAVPLGAAPAPNLPTMRNGITGDVAVPEIGSGEGAASQGLLVLGMEPADSATTVALPSGNRFGQFTTAPGGSGSGSLGGPADGVVGGGAGGGMAGGNESVGVGSGKYGGGGGNSGTSGFVSLRGPGGASENLGDPNPGSRESLVFALPKITGLRHPGIVVAAGPMGGGGLGVYGALHCGKIYTVLLPMSGKSWTLQFCPTPASGESVSAQPRSSVVHMEGATMPPEAEARYDFKRLPLPAEKTHKLIILKGTIRPEGTVENLHVHEGLMPELDAAALRAFSQWTFKPAMRDGKPVSVDILVGIPGDSATSGPALGAKVGGTRAEAQHVSNSY
jgi:hypothetical protein